MNHSHNHFFQDAGGALAEDAPSYIERPADDELLMALENGELCLVLAPRQTGKSSLMVHALARLRQQGLRTGIVDAQALGKEQNPEQWYSDVLYQIERTLRLRTDSYEWWVAHRHHSPTQRFMNFVEDVICTDSQDRFVLFFDEIDAALNLPFSDDFFTAIRSTYNARASNPTLRRITFVLIGHTTASALIKNRDRTPFNIGRSIVPTDFDINALAPFRNVLGQGSDEIIKRILYWTNGQPWMLQKLAAAAYSWPPDERHCERIDNEVASLFLQNDIEQVAHLRYIQNYLLADTHNLRKVLQTYLKVLRGKHVAADERSSIHDRLKLAGVVHVDNNRLAIRNWIYANVFDARWVRDHLPPIIPKVVAYGIVSIIVLIVLYIYIIIPYFFPFSLLPYQSFNRHLSEPEFKFPISRAHFDLAMIDGKEIKDFSKGNINVKLAGLQPGKSDHELVLYGLFRYQRYTVPIEVTYYPDWQIREYPQMLSDSIRDNTLVTAVAFAPGVDKVAMASDATNLKLIDIDTGRELRTLHGHTEEISSVAFSPDGKIMISSSANDYTLKVWDVATGHERRTLSGHKKIVNTIAFAPDGEIVVSGSDDNTLKVWHVETGHTLHTLGGHTQAILGAAFSPDGQTIVSGSLDITLKRWDAATGRELNTFSGHTQGVTVVAFLPDGKRIVSGSLDRTLKVWEVDQREARLTLSGHTKGVTAVAPSPDGKAIVSGGLDDGSLDETLILWGIEKGQKVREFKGHKATIKAVAFTPNSQRIISASADATLKEWWAAIAPE